MELEKEFQISIEDDELEQIKTLGEVINLVNKKV